MSKKKEVKEEMLILHSVMYKKLYVIQQAEQFDAYGDQLQGGE